MEMELKVSSPVPVQPCFAFKNNAFYVVVSFLATKVEPTISDNILQEASLPPRLNLQLVTISCRGQTDIL